MVRWSAKSAYIFTAIALELDRKMYSNSEDHCTRAELNSVADLRSSFLLSKVTGVNKIKRLKKLIRMRVYNLDVR